MRSWKTENEFQASVFSSHLFNPVPLFGMNSAKAGKVQLIFSESVFQMFLLAQEIKSGESSSSLMFLLFSLFLLLLFMSTSSEYDLHGLFSLLRRLVLRSMIEKSAERIPIKNLHRLTSLIRNADLVQNS